MLKWEQTRASAKTEIPVNKLKPYDIFKKKKISGYTLEKWTSATPRVLIF